MFIRKTKGIRFCILLLATSALFLDASCQYYQICPNGMTMCDEVCADLSTDSDNCGSCGVVCRTDQVCSGGICQCEAGKTDCDGHCADLMIDPQNCGGCGNSCASGSQTCFSGQCVYADHDGDGYVGEEWGGDDCDDQNASVHPGAEEVCDGIDNDCDGGTDELPEAGVSCDDGDECTEDTCFMGSCRNTPASAIPCDDGLDCTVNDTCWDGVCVGEPPDEDGDGYAQESCGGDDCDDSDRFVNPGVSEDSRFDFICSDGIDNDCDGLTDHEEPDCCRPDCTGLECGDGGCPDQPTACGVCIEGYWCNSGNCEEHTSDLIWIYIPGGTFMMGSDVGYPNEKPIHQVTVPSFYMTMTEVTVSQYMSCVDSGYCTEPGSIIGCSDANWLYPGRGSHPVNCISWTQSVDFCERAGGRLPTDSEWEYAARSGGLVITYPWGNQRPTCDYAVFNPGCHEGECCPDYCIDGDQDGYGDGGMCLGQDCNDSDPSCHEGECCLRCIDVDGDGYGIGDNCLGDDDDDADSTCWANPCLTGPHCWDGDFDGYGRGPVCRGERDCNDYDPNCHEGDCCLDCIDIDGDGYGIGIGCIGQDCDEEDGFNSDYQGCFRGGTWPVCSKPAGNTVHGLCDMSGNISEWVQDCYHESYDCDANPRERGCSLGGKAPTDGSAWEDDPNCDRIFRNNDWDAEPQWIRSSFHWGDDPNSKLWYMGVRCARDAE